MVANREISSSSRWQCPPLFLAALATMIAATTTTVAQNKDEYRKPPELIAGYLKDATTPIVSFNPQRDHMLIYRYQQYPAVNQMTRAIMNLAGLRFNRINRGPVKVMRCNSLRIKPLDGGKETRVRLPGGLTMSLPIWSPTGQEFAFLRMAANSISLQVCDATTGKLRTIPDVQINAVAGTPFRWLPDGRTILCQLVDNPARKSKVPSGPVIEETSRERSWRPETEHLLSSEQDEELLEHHASAQLALVDTELNEVTPIGEPKIFSRAQPSPDGQYILVSYVKRPFPHDLLISDFPRQVEVWNRDGEFVHEVAKLPARRDVPLGGVLNEPRLYNWRPTSSAELVWALPQDAGHPENIRPFRDYLMALSAPFSEPPKVMLRSERRIESIIWGEEPHIALLRSISNDQRRLEISRFNPDSDEEGMNSLWEYHPNDRYADPGSPMMRSLPNGQTVMRIHHNSIYLRGRGPSPTGDRPFLDLFNLTTEEVEPIFESAENEYESVVSLLEADGSQIVTRRESATEPPNYYIRYFPEDEPVALTQFKDRYPELRKVHRQLISFERYDGAKMSFVVHLPPDYDMRAPNREPLPTIMWIHPRTYLSRNHVQKQRGSLRRFPSYKGATHRFLAMQGFAVLDATTIPVLGDPSTANDSFVEQIVAGAKAAIDKAVEMRFADPSRIGVAGHSYGAFLTANLLAHSDMFKAGAARSGAYNRTLTPFGFQNERRSLWQAPDLYTRLSPLMFANQIEEPLLLIHGDADENPATDPVQSKWMFQAIRGNGGTARLVTLPSESHRYEALESVEHAVWETMRWFDLHLGDKPTAVPLFPQPTLDMPEVVVP
ncbi:MAG: S9 family peptidase [Limisphaerales bacterium]